MMQTVRTTVIESAGVKVTLRIERAIPHKTPEPTPFPAAPGTPEIRQFSRARWADRNTLIFPLLVSIKHNGIRGEVTPQGARTRWMKAIPNRHIRAMLETLPPGLEGEIVIAKDGTESFAAAQSAVMREDGEPDFRFFVFDDYLYPVPFYDRYAHLAGLDLPAWAEPAMQTTAHCLDDVDGIYENAIRAGYEGLVLRDPDAEYFFGYAPAEEQAYLKLKPSFDAEATVTGIVPSKDDPGRCRALTVRSDAFPGTKFRLSSGLTAAERRNPPQIGETVTFSYQRGEGRKPRHAAYIGVRKEMA